MQNNMIWFDRKFDFFLPPELFPMLVERLRGAPARLEEKVKGLDEGTLTKKIDEGWSVKEQVGHLCVVEELWIGRMDDYKNGTERLRPADLKNTKTKESNFNEADINDLLKLFRKMRKELVDRLDAVEPDKVEQTALHPRLDKPMRIIDLVYFGAEHDDHHLAKMTDLIRS
jgi:uncharacterized damage-inducible protein DinB